MIEYIKGDLLATDCNLIVHGCNASGGFGSGVAGQIAIKFPDVARCYATRFSHFGFKLGEIQCVYRNPQKAVVNCITQKSFGGDGKQYVDYDAIKSCMCQVKNLAERSKFTVAMPKIGAGLGGGDWNKIEKIINEVFGEMPVKVYVR